MPKGERGGYEPKDEVADLNAQTEERAQAGADEKAQEAGWESAEEMRTAAEELSARLAARSLSSEAREESGPWEAKPEIAANQIPEPSEADSPPVVERALEESAGEKSQKDFAHEFTAAAEKLVHATGNIVKLRELRREWIEQGLVKAESGTILPISDLSEALLDDWKLAADEAASKGRARAAKKVRPRREGTQPKKQESAPRPKSVREENNTKADGTEAKKVESEPAENQENTEHSENSESSIDQAHQETTEAEHDRAGEHSGAEETKLQPEPEPGPERGLELHAASIDAVVRQKALDAAQARIEKEAAAAKGVKGLVRKVWHGTFAHEYYRQKYAAEAEAKIRFSENQFALEGKDGKAHNKATGALIDRLVRSQYSQDLQLSKGERVEEMGDSEDERAFKDGMREIIGKFATGGLDGESLREERTRLLQRLREEHPEILEGAKMMADNLITVAEQAKAMVKQGNNLESMLEGIRFYGDQARAGARTEASRNACDRMIEKLQGGRAGRWVNEATIASGVSIAYSAATVLSRRTVGSTLATVAPGVGAGVFAGMRENARYKQERGHHMRDRAEGKEFEPGGRRERMDKAMYEMRSARELMDTLEVGDGPLTSERAHSLMAALAEVKARQQISDMRNVDLVSFSSVENVDSERLQLQLKAAEAAAALRGWMGSASEAEWPDLPDGATFDDWLRLQTESSAMGLSAEMKSTDRTFKMMKARAIGAAVAKGTLTGLTFGIFGQDVAALATHQQGELEWLLGHHEVTKGTEVAHQTFLRGLFHKSSLHSFGTEQAGAGTHIEHLKTHGAVRLPDGYDLHHEGATVSLRHDKHDIIRGLSMDAHGFTEHSHQLLEGRGVTAESQTNPIDKARRVVETTNATEYINHHPRGTVHVERSLWYDNNTPAPVFDKNELKLEWGGVNGSGLTSGGDYAYSMSQMMPDGSYHDQFSANAQELMREGKLRLLISANEGTQSHPFEFKVNQNATAIIPKGSDAGHTFFSYHNGQVSSKARYTEFAQVIGRHNGREVVRVLATDEGPGVENIRHLVTRPETAQHLLTRMNIPTEAVAGPVDAPPFIPINWRRELEPVRPRAETTRPRYGYGYDGAYGERGARAERISPRLEQNPHAKLVMKDELASYFDREREGSAEYVGEIDQFVEQDDLLRNLPKGTRAIVAIPAAAAFEKQTLYNTLQQHAGQDEEALRQTVFLINLNWKEGANPEDVHETIEWVERAKQDFPQMQIAYITQEMPQEWIRARDGAIWGALQKRLYDVALRSVQKAADSGELENPDVLLVHNDADTEGLTPHFLQTYINSMDEEPDAEILYGFIRWGTKAFKDYPGYAFSATAMSVMEQYLRKDASGEKGGTLGPNSAFRMSALAAAGGADGDIGAGGDLRTGERILAARGLSRHRSSGSYVPSVAGADVGGQTRRYSRRVATVVDTSPERLLKAYSSGKTLGEAWNGYNDPNDGYVPRVGMEVKGKESLRTASGYREVCGRIENQMNGLRAMYGLDLERPEDMAMFTSCMDQMLPPDTGNRLWRLQSAEGHKEFRLTKAGSEWLRPRLVERSRAMTRRYDKRRKDAISKAQVH